MHSFPSLLNFPFPVQTARGRRIKRHVPTRTRIEDIPLLCPTASTSSYGQNRSDSTRAPPPQQRWLRYGADAFVESASFQICRGGRRTLHQLDRKKGYIVTVTGRRDRRCLSRQAAAQRRGTAAKQAIATEQASSRKGGGAARCAVRARLHPAPVGERNEPPLGDVERLRRRGAEVGVEGLERANVPHLHLRKPQRDRGAAAQDSARARQGHHGLRREEGRRGRTNGAGVMGGCRWIVRSPRAWLSAPEVTR